MRSSNDIFKVNDVDLGSDSLEATDFGGKINIQIDEPWAGSTETGFGQTTSITISYDEAEKLGRWLIERASLLRTKDAG